MTADIRLRHFREQVAMKYQLYNGLFLALPFEEMESTGSLLPVFADYARENLEAGKSPASIVEGFFREKLGKKGKGKEERAKILFRFLQFIERQVVLFDSLEESAFSEVNDLEGPGSLRDLFSRVKAAGRQAGFARTLGEFKVRIVLTAHPTQFYPDAVLGIITDLTETVKRNDLGEINDLLLQMGRTRFKNRVKPTPVEEARSILWYLENVFYVTIPAIQTRLAFEAGAKPADLEGLIDLGFWPGGDRDGNPFVTSEVSLEVGNLLKSRALLKYELDVMALERRLTFDGVAEKLASVRLKLRRTRHEQDNRRSDRLLGEPVGAPKDCYAASQDLLGELLSIRKMLLDGVGGLFVDKLDDLLVKVRVFGFHFATLDIRQDSRTHAQVMIEIMALIAGDAAWGDEQRELAKSWPTDDEEARIRTLENVTENIPKGWKPEGWLEGMSRDTILSLRAARWIQAENGPKGVHRYIISQSQSMLDVLTVFFLARAAGFPRSAAPLDIVPLFETIEDLSNAGRIMERLYAHPMYAAHLKSRGDVQTIMLGFSDGTKDGGYVTANWAIFRAKEALTAVSRTHGVRAIFFDGRGGPPARGGGNTHKFYQSLGSRIEGREIQLTVQGQTISSKYGSEASARHNLEQLVSAGLERLLFPDASADLTASDQELIDELSAESRREYLALKEDPGFLTYLEEATPLEYYGETNIGSRPTKRGKAARLKFEDLRAIPFVGSWAQMKQNIPGYYGFGGAVERLIRKGRSRELTDLYRRSLFFRTLVENTMQSLSKCYFPLTAYLKRDAKFGKLWKRIKAEADLTEKRLLELAGQTVLLESDPITRESILLRERMVLPLLIIQQSALSTLRQSKSGATLDADTVDTARKLVVKSMMASINASRNSA